MELRMRVGILGAAAMAVLLGVAPAYAKKTPTETPTASPTETPTEASPTEVPTEIPTAEPTSTPGFDPGAPPILGGSIRVISMADAHGIAGDVVDAGSFEILNTTDSVESVRVIRLGLSESEVFSELTLDTSEGSTTISFPSSQDEFRVEPPILILPGSSAVFALTGTIASSGSSSGASSGSTSTPLPSSTATPTETPTSDLVVIGLLGRGPTKPSTPPPGGEHRDAPLGPIAVGMTMAGLSAALLASVARRRRGLLALSVVLLGIALYAGCGSDQTSEQTVIRMEVETPTRPALINGLPVSLGTVSRPLPLVFPGAAATATP